MTVESARRYAIGGFATKSNTADSPRRNIAALTREALQGLVVPAEFGGLDADSLIFAETIESISFACAATGMDLVMHSCAIRAIRLYMFGKRRTHVLSAAAKGNHLCTLACAERGTGANAGTPGTTSSLRHEAIVIDGEKYFVPVDSRADSFIVSARSALPAEGPVQTSLYFVERNTRGLSFAEVSHEQSVPGPLGVAMKLDQCVIPLDCLIGDHGQGMMISADVITPLFLLGCAAVTCGTARARFEAFCHQAKIGTTCSGDPLTSVSLIRRKVGEMKVSLDSARAILEKAALAREQNLDSALLLLMEAKHQATEVSNEIARIDCAKMEDSREGQLSTTAVDCFTTPSSAVLLDLIGRSVLQLPLK